MSGANGAISVPRTKPIASELVKIGWIHYALNRDLIFPPSSDMNSLVYISTVATLGVESFETAYKTHPASKLETLVSVRQGIVATHSVIRYLPLVNCVCAIKATR
jgi:hypothetical protein